jgi:hypothetical protein
MNRSVIRTTARKKLGETTAVFYEDSLLNQWAEDAQLDIVWKTLCNKARSTATPTADTVRYTLSTDILDNALKILSVRIYDGGSSVWRRLTHKTQQYLDRVYPQWQSSDAAPPRYYIYDIETDEFILYPKADSDNVSTDGLELYSVTKPTAMSSDSSSPDLPETLHPAVITYMVATGLESRGYQDIANTQWTVYSTQLSSYLALLGKEPDDEVVMHAER